MPSPWDDNVIELQGSIALDLWYRTGGRCSGSEIAAAINANPMAIVARTGRPREIHRHQALKRVREAIRARDAHGDLADYRARFMAQLEYALAKVLERVAGLDGLDPSGEHRAAVQAMVELHREIGLHTGLHRLSPPAVDDTETMTDAELIQELLGSLSPVDLAVLAPDVVRSAADELGRIEGVGREA